MPLAELISPTTGGQDALDAMARLEALQSNLNGRNLPNNLEQLKKQVTYEKIDKLDKLKSTMLRRGRIVTRADVETFCFEMVGRKRLQHVSIKDGVGTDPRFNFGMTRLIDVLLTPTEEARVEDWSGTCQQLHHLLEKQSSSNIPFRVSLTANKAI